MASTVFYFLLNMSITATAIGLFLLLLRSVKRIPRTFVYPLWGLMLLRLVLPVTLSSEVSVFNAAGLLIKKVMPVKIIPIEVHVPVVQDFDFSTMNSVGLARTYPRFKAPEMTFQSNQIADFFDLAANAWFIGVLALLLMIVFFYIMNRIVMGRLEHFKDNVYMGKTDGPFVYGLFRQKIIVPPGLTEEQLENVLLHENVHVRRWDNFLRLIALLVACLHWFNPLVWIFLKCFLTDMELTCDARAVKKMTGPQRTKYAETLLELGTGMQLSLNAGFGKIGLRTRLLNVLHYKRLTWLGSVIAIVCIVALFVMLATNPISIQR